MKKILLPLFCLFFGLFLIYPLVSLLQGAFVVEVDHAGGQSRQFSLQYFSLIFENPFYRDCFVNSLYIGLWSTIGCIIIAFPLAYLFERTDFFGKAFFPPLLLVPLILPPFVGAIGLQQIMSRFGSFNLLLSSCGLIRMDHPIDWFGQGGFAGIILLNILHLYPIMFLSLQAALGNIDPSLRAAGKNLGAHGWYLFRTITLPLAAPAVFASGSIIFISAFTDLGVPLMFNFTRTVPTQIFDLVTQTDHPIGYALVVLTLLLVAGLFLVGRGWGDGHAMMARSASYEEKIVLVGPRSLFACAAVALLFLLSVIPHLGVILQSFSDHWFLTIIPEQWTTTHYQEVCSLPLTLASLQNSLIYSGASAVLDLFLGTLIAYVLARESFPCKGLLDTVAMIPLALPGLVSAFAYFVAFSRGPFPASMIRSNHLWLALFDPRQNPTFILIIAYAMHRLPYMVRSAYSGLQQNSVALEEASSNLGSSPIRTILRITLPLLGAHLIAGLIMTFSFAMLDVSNGMMLAQEPGYYPLTKAIYTLMGRILPDASALACALGVLGMLFIGLCLWICSILFGQKTSRFLRP